MNSTQVKINIKPEHTDTFGHLNNSFYDFYFELGRVALQKSVEIDDASLNKMKLGLWVQDTFIRRKKQVKANQEVSIKSSFIGYHGVKIYMRHQIFHKNIELAYAISEHYLVNLADKPIVIDLLPSLKEKTNYLQLNKSFLPSLINVIEFFENKKRMKRFELLKAKRK